MGSLGRGDSRVGSLGRGDSWVGSLGRGDSPSFSLLPSSFLLLTILFPSSAWCDGMTREVLSSCVTLPEMLLNRLEREEEAKLSQLNWGACSESVCLRGITGKICLSCGRTTEGLIASARLSSRREMDRQAQ